MPLWRQQVALHRSGWLYKPLKHSYDLGGEDDKTNFDDDAERHLSYARSSLDRLTLPILCFVVLVSFLGGFLVRGISGTGIERSDDTMLQNFVETC